MKILSISEEPNVSILQMAYAITEMKLHNAPLIIDKINTALKLKKDRVEEIEAQSHSDEFKQALQYFDTELNVIDNMFNHDSESLKLNQEIERLEGMKSDIIRDSVNLASECQQAVKDRLFKEGAGLKEYAVSLSIGKYTKYHAFTNEDHLVNIVQFREKLSEVFKKHDPEGLITGYTSIRMDELDDKGFMLDRKYIENAVYFHFSEQSIPIVDAALSEFMDICIEKDYQARLKDKENMIGYDLAKMINDDPGYIQEWAEKNARSESEKNCQFYVNSFRSNTGLSLSREEGIPEHKFTFNQRRLLDSLKPNHKEHYPNNSPKYKEWSENAFGGNSGIDRTERGMEAARILSIESYISENPKEHALAYSYLKKLEKSLSKTKDDNNLSL